MESSGASAIIALDVQLLYLTMSAARSLPM